MNSNLIPYFGSFSFSGDLRKDVTAVLTHYHLPKVAGHVSRVAQEAKRLAIKFNTDPIGAEMAGWLHDISGFIPNEKRVALCQALNISVLPGEASFPMILHQKLSAIIAQEVFSVVDTAVLNAIGCHTTLKSGATLLDKVVFVADKIKWDQAGDPPYLAEIETAVSHSIDTACLVYLRYLWQQRDTLHFAHPWFLAAYQELSQM